MSSDPEARRTSKLLCLAGTALVVILVISSSLHSDPHVRALQTWVSASSAIGGAAATSQSPRRPWQRSHHMYTSAPDPYSCDFAHLPGAWTGNNVLQDDAQASGSVPAAAGQPEAGGASGNGDGRIGVTAMADRATSGALYGTAIAQAAIWAHQHPKDCSKQSFLLHTPQRGGIGSQIHVLGLAIATAMDLGRIVLLDTDVRDALFTDDEYCGPKRPNLDDCYFERLSSCTLADTGLNRTQLDTAPMLNMRRKQAQHKVLRDRNGKNLWRGSTKRRVPQRFEVLLLGSPVRDSARYYWWRAQAAMYVVRPNARTQQQLVELRAKTLRGGLSSFGAAVSVHVRHGDKHREAKEQPSEAYFDRARTLYAEAGGTLQQQMFLSTEDPAVVSWFTENATGWGMAYTDSVRKPDPTKSTRAYAKQRGPAAEYLDSLLNLELALECGAWVGTLTSNWCRLIDELRSTVRCKADGRYLDAAQGDPPKNLGWR